MSADSGNASEKAAFERLFQHGGDINSARAAFPDALQPWIDLSTGLNPVSYPLPRLHPEVWTRLPAPEALEELQSAAGAAYGVAPDRVAAAAGVQALLPVLPRLLSAKRVSLLGPTYSEHERAWRAAGADVEIVGDLDEATAEQVVLVNPNNPDGRLIAKGRLAAFARRLGAEGRRLIVDEAFMDFDFESIAAEPFETTVTLRSFGKAYGLAGLRLGFAIAPREIAARLRDALGPWPVSGPALLIGARALSDRDWLDRARLRLEEDAGWLDEALTTARFVQAGRARLFRLARRTDARAAFVHLARRGVLVRPFNLDSTLLRFGIPTREQRPRVRDALEAACRD